MLHSPSQSDFGAPRIDWSSCPFQKCSLFLPHIGSSRCDTLHALAVYPRMSWRPPRLFPDTLMAQERSAVSTTEVLLWKGDQHNIAQMLYVFQYIDILIMMISNRNEREWSQVVLGEGRVRLGTRKNFFSAKMVRHWKRLPREMVESLSPVLFNSRVDLALRDAVSARGVDSGTKWFCGLFQP